MDLHKNFIENPLFKKKYNLNQEKIIALLPGSRLQEINKILPVFIKVAKKFNEYQFIIAGAPGIPLKSMTLSLKIQILRLFTTKLTMF